MTARELITVLESLPSDMMVMMDVSRMGSPVFKFASIESVENGIEVEGINEPFILISPYETDFDTHQQNSN